MDRKRILMGYLCIGGVSALVGAEDEQQVQPEDAGAVQDSSVQDSSAPLVWRTHERAQAQKKNPFRGNWFKKRTLVADARSTYEAIHHILVEQWEPQLQTFARSYEQSLQRIRDGIGKIPYTRARIDELEPEAKLLDTGRPLELIVEAQKAFDLMPLLASNGEEILALVKKHLALVATYEKDAWSLYEQIDDAYDDDAAAQLYGKLQGMRLYSEQFIVDYFQKRLMPYAEGSMRTYDETVQVFARVKEGLKAYDIYVIPEEKPAPVAAVPNRPAESAQSWFSWMMQPLWKIDDAFWAAYRWCIGWFI